MAERTAAVVSRRSCVIGVERVVERVVRGGALVSTLVSCVVKRLWICVSYRPIGGIFIFAAMPPKISPTGASLKYALVAS